MDVRMDQTAPQDGTSSATTDSTATARGLDDWQRRFGVPWDRVDRAARAVLERAAAASRRRFAELGAGGSSSLGGEA